MSRQSPKPDRQVARSKEEIKKLISVTIFSARRSPLLNVSSVTPSEWNSRIIATCFSSLDGRVLRGIELASAKALTPLVVTE